MFWYIFIFYVVVILLMILLMNFLMKIKKFENFDEETRALYINLDDRKDRKDQIEKELNEKNIKYERFSAVKNENGALGCSKSHLNVIKLAKERNYDQVIIFEDDFEFIVNKDEYNEEMNKLNNVNFDVCLLSYNTQNFYPSEYDFLYKIKDALTCSGYIVNSHYYDRLISCWEESVEMFEKTGDIKYTSDLSWLKLQENDNWVCFKKRLGKQRASYSNIQKHQVDYNV